MIYLILAAACGYGAWYFFDVSAVFNTMPSPEYMGLFGFFLSGGNVMLKGFGVLCAVLCLLFLRLFYVTKLKK